MVSALAPVMLLTGGSTTTTIDTSGIVTGLTTGVNSMLSNFLDMLGDILPVAFPILGVTVGLYFCIKLVRSFM